MAKKQGKRQVETPKWMLPSRRARPKELPGSAGAFGTRNQNPIKGVGRSETGKEWDTMLGSWSQPTAPDRAHNPKRKVGRPENNQN